ncbi:hypothetical protein GCM10011321_36360 [Youhaiella tibetensis]|jgi:hypothetical protein|uniref:Uncharacterized protein n=1 Tax=Paradevosia tibetensis TaxID=1447062 RepID=A0A5B9DSJ3_9HYPH|nr:hypothetical protein [Youhaiella tibetensis]AKR57483.1 hypothetical protein XM25_17185 [Devosia sp. H5989]QEE22411.1 hypothetical protein FNA67_20590 [Youhaiella tibetensis]GGF42465.1 hypothetical protein GCM10011321_36360 [Youhaiella tibetensis]
MKDTHVLTRHSDIQNWVSARNGLPAIAKVRNHLGMEQSQLHLRFSRPRRTPVTTPSLDDGMSPCSWSAWLAELDRQHLALRVSTNASNYELVDRKDLH